ncbi:MAG: hypothetical protein KF819_04445 [Labilithrix sp.]|nr:hypothetical protein [Labilithrix sp.]
MQRSARVLACALFVMLAGCSSAAEEVEPTGNVNPGGGPGTPPEPEPAGPTTPTATCTMRADVPLTYEEKRLVNRLPGKSVAFSEELLKGTGFDVFEPDFSKELCKDGIAGAATFDAAKALVSAAGTRLWRAAVDRVQGRRPSGTLPAGDDRMLYWARLTMTKTLRAWAPSFELDAAKRADLEWELERASRGQLDVKLPPGSNYVRVLVSGFDPFTLGTPGATDDASIKIGNPSGASALAYDGYELTLPNGKTAHIEAFTLPVNYGPFERGMQEETLGPWFSAGPSQVDISITMSQGGGYRFKLEEYNGRYHGLFAGNDDVATCNGSFLPSVDGCNIHPSAKWIGYDSRPWRIGQPPQFVESTLPVDKMIAANTGTRVPRPPDSQAAGGNAFDVVWGYDYGIFTSCTASETQSLYSPVSTTYPPPVMPSPPSASTCARSGSGGDYLSNESAYRATLLRDVMGLTIPVGHIHTPVMTRFLAGNESEITDSKFEAYRAAIVLQGRLLVEEVAKSL